MKNEKLFTLILRTDDHDRVVMEHVKESEINYYKKWYAAVGEIELEEETIDIDQDL